MTFEKRDEEISTMTIDSECYQNCKQLGGGETEYNSEYGAVAKRDRNNSVGC